MIDRHSQLESDRFWPELRRLVDGRLALPVYMSVGDLVSACGPHQPWVAVPVEALEQLREHASSTPSP